MKQKIHILIGLPGSGKTTHIAKQNQNLIRILDLDGISPRDIFYKVPRFLLHWGELSYDLYIDGQFLTIEDLEYLIENMAETNIPNLNIVLHYWFEDRVQCLKNDAQRVDIFGTRDRRSEMSIKHKPYMSHKELADFVAKNKNSNIEFEIMCHNVYRPDDFDDAVNKYLSYNEEGHPEIKSKKWSNGGTWGNYNGTIGNIAPEEPSEFEEFDEILSILRPEITFLQYKKLKKDCMELRTWTERDYYGGSESMSQYVVDIEKLRECLEALKQR